MVSNSLVSGYFDRGKPERQTTIFEWQDPSSKETGVIDDSQKIKQTLPQAAVNIILL